MLYLLIIFLFLFVVYKHKTWARLASVSMILLSIFVGNRWVNNNRLKQITVYNIPYHLSLDLTQSGKIITLMDSVLELKTDKIHFHINPNRLLLGVDTYADTLSHAWQQLPYGKALVWNNTSILILEEAVKQDNFPFDIVLSNLDTDKLIVNLKIYNIENRGAFVINSDTPFFQ